MPIMLPRLALAALGAVLPALACAQGFLPGDWHVACDAWAGGCTVSYGYACADDEQAVDAGPAIVPGSDSGPVAPIAASTAHRAGCGWMSSSLWAWGEAVARTANRQEARRQCDWAPSTRWAWNGRKFVPDEAAPDGLCMGMAPLDTWDALAPANGQPLPMNAT